MKRTEREIIMRYKAMEFFAEKAEDFAAEYSDDEKIALAYQVVCAAQYEPSQLILAFPEFIYENNSGIFYYISSIEYNDDKYYAVGFSQDMIGNICSYSREI